MQIKPSQDYPVILTRKITAPSVPSDVLVRERLLARMREYSPLPVTLIQAAAGYGKSCLMATWRNELQSTCLCAWVSLNPEDTALDRFWSYLLSAFASEGIALDELIVETKNLQDFGEALPLIDRLLAELQNYGTCITLFLDDYHTIHKDSPVQSSLAYFIAHMPDKVHLVLATRSHVNLGLSKLQVQGLLGKITQNELAFTLPEIEHYFAQTQATISEESLELVFDQSGGWAVAVKLFSASEDYTKAAAELQTQSQAKELVSDYLFEEVISKMSPQMREFLAATCCLKSFSVPLACFLLNSTEDEVLSSLSSFIEENLFITRYGEKRGVAWYRYHSLFAEAALQHFLSMDPSCVHKTKQRALAWYEHNHYLDEAVMTAAHLEDYPSIERFILTYWSSLCTEDKYVQLMRWFEYLPDDYTKSRNVLAAIESLPLALTGKTDTALRRIQEAESLLASTDDELYGFVMGFKSITVSTLGDFEATRKVAELALKYLAEEEVYLTHINLQLLAGTYSEMEPEKAIEIYEDSLLDKEIIQLNNTFRYSVQSCLCFLNTLLGQFEESEKWAKKALGLYPAQEHPRHPILYYCYVARMNTYYQRADIPRALEHAHYALAHAYDCWNPVLMAQVQGLIALTDFALYEKLSSGKAGAEAFALDEAATELRFPGNVVAGTLALSKLGFSRNFPSLPALTSWLSEGLLSRNGFMVSEARVTEDPIVWVDAALGYLEGDYSDVDLLVERYLSTPEIRRLSKLYFALIIALIYEALAEQAQADTWFALYLSLTQELQAKQSCYANAPLLHDLLKRQITHHKNSYAAGLFKGLPSKGTRKQLPPHEHPELTMREREIMRLIGEGLSTKEIAQVLFISYETAKKHIANCYQKMGTHSRVQAVSSFEARYGK